MSVHRGGGPDRSPLPVKEQPPPPPYDYDPDRDVEDEEEQLGRQEEYKPCVIRYITALSRSAGVITVIILWLFTGLLLRHMDRYKYAPWYLLGISILLTFFETIWMINKCVIACIKHKCCCHERRQDGCCCTFWRFLVWIDTWRKTILYVAFAIPCFLQDIATTETIISGLLLLVTAVFYFAKSFKDSTCVNRKRYKHAVVQTSPKTSLVAHGVQMGVNGSPPNYRSTHTSPATVQPQDQARVSEPNVNLDPSGRKRQRYSSPHADRRGSPQGVHQDRSPDSPYSQHSDERDGDRYYTRHRERRDSYDRERRGSYDRDRRGSYDRERRGSYDRDVESGRDRRRDRYESRPSPRDTSRERPRSPRHQERDTHTDQPSGHQQKDQPASGRKTQSSPSKEQPKPEPPPVKPPTEVPPLKELPPQASEGLRRSAAADLVKQVASGSPVATDRGSTPSGMPNKLEKKAANMANPYEDRPVSTNPFDEPDEDEYFD